MKEGKWEEGKEYFEKVAALDCLAAFKNLGSGSADGDFGSSNADYVNGKKWLGKGAQLGY
jgi:TPR repeat protein